MVVHAQGVQTGLTLGYFGFFSFFFFFTYVNKKKAQKHTKMLISDTFSSICD